MTKFLNKLNVTKFKTKDLINLFYNKVLDTNPSCFCEIGARDASASLFISKKLPNCEIYCYEANPYVYKTFQPIIYKKNVNIRYINLAISDNRGFVPFYIQNNKPQNCGSNSLLQRSKNINYEIIKIECNKLDNIIYRDNHSYALWIDAEGCGYEVLLGAENILKQTSIIYIEVESVKFWKDQKLDEDIFQLLSSYQFFPIGFDSQYYDKQYNIIFAKT